MGKRSSDVFIIGEEGLLADEDLGREFGEAAPEPETVEEGDWSPFDPDEGEWRDAEVRSFRPRLVWRYVVAVAVFVAVAFVVTRLVVSATSAVVPTRPTEARQASVESASVVGHRGRTPHRRHDVRRHVPRSGHGASVPVRASRRREGSVSRHSLHTTKEKVSAGAPKGREPVEQAASVSAPAVTPAPEVVVVEVAAETDPVESVAETPPPAPVAPPVEGQQERTGGEDFGFER